MDKHAALLTDIAAPENAGVYEKEQEKIHKYQDLAMD